jgi:hypothetical protein
MSVASGSFRPGRADVVLFVPALISRLAVYVTRTYGGVGGALSDGRPYPDRSLIKTLYFINLQTTRFLTIES